MSMASARRKPMTPPPISMRAPPVQGNPFAQAMLGLLYDKGHGVPQDFVLAYKWLNLAAARTSGRERDAYARFRNAVASKMSTDEIVIGQRLALNWAPAFAAPVVRPLAK
ncbi:hypothetical protein [Bradyrhizobium sp. USDA 10063]